MAYTSSVFVVVSALPWVAKVERTVCVFLSVMVLPACVRVLDSTDVAFTTEVLRMGDGV